MNLSLEDVDGSLLIVSQFTLFGDCKKGRRPSFAAAGKPEFANKMYEKFVKYCKEKVSIVETGEFGAFMKVNLLNNGPVTILLDKEFENDFVRCTLNMIYSSNKSREELIDGVYKWVMDSVWSEILLNNRDKSSFNDKKVRRKIFWLVVNRLTRKKLLKIIG